MEFNQNTELGQDREAALCHGLEVWDHRGQGGDQQPGTDVTGACRVPSACVPPPHSFEDAKNPKPPAPPSFFVPSSQEEEAVKPKVAVVHPEFQ